MKIWPVIYLLLIPLVIFSGYRELRPEETARTNADWIFVTITFVGGSVFPLCAVAYSFNYSKKKILQKPSWDRHPLGWWTDTLQSLRISLVYSALFAFGALLALPGADEKGRMIFFWLVAMAAGLFVGERLVYAVYRKKIGA
jgi:hypothetical protein